MEKETKETPARVSRITIPPRAHPAARLLFKLMAEQHLTYDFVEFYSGILRSTMKSYRTANVPGLSSIQACLGVCGYEFLPVPKAEKLPSEVRDDLAAVVEKWKLQGDGVPELIAACADLPRDTKPAPMSIPAERAGSGPAVHPSDRLKRPWRSSPPRSPEYQTSAA